MIHFEPFCEWKINNKLIYITTKRNSVTYPSNSSSSCYASAYGPLSYSVNMMLYPDQMQMVTSETKLFSNL